MKNAALRLVAMGAIAEMEKTGWADVGPPCNRL